MMGKKHLMGSWCSNCEVANALGRERGQASMRNLRNFLHAGDEALLTLVEVTADMLVVRVIRNDVEGTVFVFSLLPEDEGTHGDGAA